MGFNRDDLRMKPGAPTPIRPWLYVAVAAINSLIALAFISWEGHASARSLLGLAIIAGLGGLTALLCDRRSPGSGFFPLVMVSAMPAISPRLVGGGNLVDVIAKSLIFGLANMATCYFLSIGLAHHLRSRKSKATPPMWDADADRPLAPEGPL